MTTTILITIMITMVMTMNTEIKYYCVWSEFDTILCLTTDYGIALDVFANHMTSVGRLTDDSWSETSAHIEDFYGFPSEADHSDIFNYITDVEKNKWFQGETVMI